MKPGLGLANGQDHHIVRILRTALSVRVEIAHSVQLIAEKFSADGAVGGRGVDIQNTAADGKLAGTFHHAAPAVAGTRQPADQCVQIIFFSGFQAESSPLQHPGRHGTLAQCFPGEDLKSGSTVGEVKELPKPLLLPSTGNNCGIIQGQFPAGKNGRGFSQKSLQFLLQPLGGHVILADEYNGTLQVLPQTCNQVAAVDLADAGDSSGLIAVKPFQQRGKFRHGL